MTIVAPGTFILRLLVLECVLFTFASTQNKGKRSPIFTVYVASSVT